MKIENLEEDIKRSKERSPETYNEITNISIPFYMFYNKMYGGICKLEEEKYQLTHSELDVLTCLKMAENDEHILSPTKIYERLLFTGGAITKVLKKLEKKEYIKRLENKFDKRSKLVQLTTLGKEIHDKALKDVLAFEEQCFSALNKEEKKQFQELLIKMLRNAWILGFTHILELLLYKRSVS